MLAGVMYKCYLAQMQITLHYVSKLTIANSWATYSFKKKKLQYAKILDHFIVWLTSIHCVVIIIGDLYIKVSIQAVSSTEFQTPPWCVIL